MISRLVVSLLLIIFLSPSSNAAVQAGSPCQKLGIKSVKGGVTYSCVKSGKKLIWDKGINSKVNKPASTTNSLPASEILRAKEGESCKKMGLQAQDSRGMLECRRFAENKLAFVRISKNFPPIVNPMSPDPMSLCQLSDKRTVVPEDLRNGNMLAIAYPPNPFSNFPGATGTFKVSVVGVDFSDAPGKGLPSDLWKEDLVKAREWMKWYTNDKVKLEFVTYPKWLRAPKASAMYEADNNGDRGPGDIQTGGLTAQEMSNDYIHTIEDYADLKDVTSIWVYLPADIKKPDGQFQPQNASVQTKKFGFVKSQLVVVGADTYLSKRPRWAYYLHEMIHGMGIQGHSPKFIPADGTPLNKIGQMSNADGWTNALLPWDALTWGVSKPSDVYCIDKSHLSSVELKLVPLEREQEGIRSAMVRLNDHQLLLVESHQSDKWGVGEGPGFDVVMVAIIDTTVSTTFDGPNTATDPCTISTGVYLKVPNASHGKHMPIGTKIINDGAVYYGSGMFNGVAIGGDYHYWDLNRFMFIGESITNTGVKITFVKGGDNDTIKIENIDNSVNEYQQPPTPEQCKSRLVPMKGYSGSGSGVSSGGAKDPSFRLPFLESTEISSPTNLKISVSGDLMVLTWNHVSTGSIKTEFYRVRGECKKDGVGCGTFFSDNWNLPSTNGSTMSLDVTTNLIGNPSSGSQLQFYIQAANQTQKLSAPEMKFELVIL